MCINSFRCKWKSYWFRVFNFVISPPYKGDVVQRPIEVVLGSTLCQSMIFLLREKVIVSRCKVCFEKSAPKYAARRNQIQRGSLVAMYLHERRLNPRLLPRPRLPGGLVAMSHTMALAFVLVSFGLVLRPHLAFGLVSRPLARLSAFSLPVSGFVN